MPSMEGGVRTPPNRRRGGRGGCRARAFNGGRRAHAAESSEAAVAGGVAAEPSMEGGVRTPPNRSCAAAARRSSTLQWRAACARRRIRLGDLPLLPRRDPSMEGGVRTPPNRRAGWRCCSAPRPFNGGRRAHAAESDPETRPPTMNQLLQWRAACARRRIGTRRGVAACRRLPFNGGRRAHAAEWGARLRVCAHIDGPSMEGGVRTPPNLVCAVATAHRRPPSMEGGVRTPPNAAPVGTAIWLSVNLQWRAACARRRMGVPEAAVVALAAPSMEGGVRTPPNSVRAGRGACGRRPSMEGGVRTPPNRRRDQLGARGRGPSMEGGVRTPPNGSLRLRGLTREYSL